METLYEYLAHWAGLILESVTDSVDTRLACAA